MTMLDYTPVSHPNMNGTYRVAMRKTEDGEYVIHVAQYQVRCYTDDTLPDRVKSMLSMIHAFPQQLRESWNVGSSDMFINNQTPELNDIGWQVTKNLYILVLDQEYLFQMWGNKI